MVHVVNINCISRRTHTANSTKVVPEGQLKTAKPRPLSAESMMCLHAVSCNSHLQICVFTTALILLLILVLHRKAAFES